MSSISRPSGRQANQLRSLNLITGFNPYAEGSCLIQWGNTHVLCTATVEDKCPPFLKGQGKGWITAEYGMLPRSTQSRNPREAARGKQGGRTTEIQRLIGRSLRAVVDLIALGERQVILDCDVLQADGGTRTASITGGFVALTLALDGLVSKGLLPAVPLLTEVAAVSCGIMQGQAVLDLDYVEDSGAEADMNFILTSDKRIVEIQGTAEEQPFSDEDFQAMYALARHGIEQLVHAQREAIAAHRHRHGG